MNNLFEKRWFNILTLLLSILGVIATVIMSLALVKERKPIFLVEPIKSLILDSKKLEKAPIKILRKDSGNEIKSDLLLLKFYFWNRGKQSIKKEDILKKIIISFNDYQNEIIDFRLIKITRDVTKINLKRYDKDPQRKLELNFKILEKNDGFLGQIIYSGNPKAKLEISGTIEGVKKILTNKSMSFLIERFISLSINQKIFYVLIAIITIFLFSWPFYGIILLISLGIRKIFQKDISSNSVKKIQKLFYILSLIISLLFCSTIIAKRITKKYISFNQIIPSFFTENTEN